MHPFTLRASFLFQRCMTVRRSQGAAAPAATFCCCHWQSMVLPALEVQTSRPKGCSGRGIKPNFPHDVPHKDRSSCSYILTSCLLQYKEIKHSKVRNEHGSWHPQFETVFNHITNTPWSLEHDSFMVPVVDAQTADDLYLPLAGEEMCLLCKCNSSARAAPHFLPCITALAEGDLVPHFDKVLRTPKEYAVQVPGQTSLHCTVHHPTLYL